MTAYVKSSGAWVMLDGAPGGWGEATGGTTTTFTGNGTTGENGRSYTVHTYLANGSFVVTRAGFFEVNIVGDGGGSGGNYAAGGHSGACGGEVLTGKVWLDVGTYAVVVGPGGRADADQCGGNGKGSSLGGLLRARGGQGGRGGIQTPDGAAFGTLGTTGQGSSGAGGNGSGTSGGPGLAVNFDGSSKTYGAGGSYNSPTAATANTGNGANSPSKAGGSGKVQVRRITA